MAEKRRLGVLLSGRGSNFLAICHAIAEGVIPDATIVAVVSDVADAPGLNRAVERGLPAFPIPREGLTRSEHEASIDKILDSAGVELVCLAGYMRILSPDFVRRWRGRILNIHPALLPKFPGLHVQRRALQAGEKESGCTVHFVDEGTDTGPIVLQRRVPVLPGDTEESLSARILAEEHRAYPEAIARVLPTLPPRRQDGSKP
jgi:phosphoribosylglycinamide formyltransferase 1